VSFLARLARARAKNKQIVKVAWLGLDFAGKTTIIKRVSQGVFSDGTKRTLGMNVEEFTVASGKAQGVKFVCWDIGGQITFRQALWNSYMAGSTGIVYVVDSADSSRFSEARDELWNYVMNNEDVKSIPILILANKQDIPTSKNAGEIARSLDLHKVIYHSYAIFPTSAKTAFNLEEALEWLRQRILENV
jgi:small GTP-binding protein